MLDILHDYLISATSPENVAHIDNAHEAFDRIGLEDYTPGFEQILMLHDESDAADTLGAIIDMTQQISDGILNQHGITLVDDCDIDIKTELINALVELQKASDFIPDIIKICNQMGDPETNFSELVALVATHRPEYYVVNFAFVSQALVDRIKEIAQEQEDGTIDEVQADHELKQERIAKFNRFMHFILDPDLLFLRFIKRGLDAGFPFSLYVNMLGHEFDELDPVVIAQNMIAMALYSEDGAGNPLGVIQPFLEQFLSDVDLITKVNIQLSELIVKFQTYESTLQS